jgi:hypothetical protein
MNKEVFILDKDLFEEVLNAVGSLPSKDYGKMYFHLKNLKPANIEENNG